MLPTVSLDLAYDQLDGHSTSVNSGSKKRVELGKQFRIHTVKLLGFTRNGIKAHKKKSMKCGANDWPWTNESRITWRGLISSHSHLSQIFFHLSDKFSLASLLWLPSPSHSIYLKLFACLLNTHPNDFSLSVFMFWMSCRSP